jgi:type I restriction enzyme S subunit
MLCDKIFRVVFKSNTPILPGYLAEIMKTAHLRHQIENAVTGTSPTMKNITKTSLLGLVLPVPPLEMQQEIVDMVNQLRLRILEERKTAEEREAQAAREVEEMILGISPVK